MGLLSKITALALLGVAAILGLPAKSLAPAPASAAAANAQVQVDYGQLPLHFEANHGQTDPQVQFLARGRGSTLFLTATEAVLALRPSVVSTSHHKPDATPKQVDWRTLPAPAPTVLRLQLLGANPQPHVVGLEELPGQVHYFRGNDSTQWRTNIPTYAKVKYEGVYPGVDLIYYGHQRQLEYDFVVTPGADPTTITLGVKGADTLKVDGQGDLVLHIAGGELRQAKPVVYQEVDGVRREIAGWYVLRGEDRVGIEVGAYDPAGSLIIDPALFYATYLGTSGQDQAAGIAVDNVGNAYVTGFTDSPNFPTTAGAFDTTQPGYRDAFVTKLNPTGSGLIYSTYLGGISQEFGVGIAVDSVGNAYVSGLTYASDFPTTPGAFDTTFNGGNGDFFVTKLDATGSTLLYSTYLGGSGEEFRNAIAIDAAGNAYLTGETRSVDFPTTPGAFQTTYNGGLTDAFVTKLNPTGTALVYSTFLGGSDIDLGSAIAVDATGSAYVTGEWTDSSNFPTTPGAFDTTFNGRDGFLTKLNPTGTALVYSTFLGGGGGLGIAVDAASNAYVTGSTQSSTFATPGAFDTTYNGGASDAFVTKFNATGTVRLYSTYLGGSGQDFAGGQFAAFGIAVDAAGNAYVTGDTDSPDFPTTPGAFQTTLNGTFDAFVTKLNPTGTALVYSTYLGGSGGDGGQSIALDTLPNPNAYVSGITESIDFPTTAGAFQTTFGGFQDGFVAKIADIVLPPPPTVGKVTGGGSITVPSGIGTFGFIVQRQTTTGPISGDLQYVNHASSSKVHSVTFTSLVVVGNTATFGGACTNNGAPCTFSVDVTDNGEPGRTDTFKISVSAGPAEGGTLRSGNIQIHD